MKTKIFALISLLIASIAGCSDNPPTTPNIPQIPPVYDMTKNTVSLHLNRHSYVLLDTLINGKSQLRYGNEYTVMLWIKMDTLTKHQPIIIKNYVSKISNPCDIKMEIARGIFYCPSTTTSPNILSLWDVSTRPIYKADRWYHIALVMKTGDVMKVYLDGVWTYTSKDTINYIQDNYFNTGLGMFPGITSIPSNFRGNFSNVMIYSKALSVELINDLMHRKLDLTNSTDTDKLIGYWDLNGTLINYAPSAVYKTGRVVETVSGDTEFRTEVPS